MEQEQKHQAEIAQIREEQVRMMSQLMLLNAGGKDGTPSKEVQAQQA